MVPQPCIALVFLYPISENTVRYDLEEESKVQTVSDKVYFMR